MAKQVFQDKKAIFSLMIKVRQLNLSVEVFIEIFERLIIPVLLYGSEIQGYGAIKQLQVMTNNFMRKMLKLHKSTPVCMLIGELGLKNSSEYIENRMLNFWCNIATDDSKISSILYKWIKIRYN
ncbi:unnamed protein product, partial [Meganyctiphanes norvegica]